MEDQTARKIKELQDKIMAKRQQIEFEKTDIELTREFAPENRENPDVSEEFKNYNDQADNVIEKSNLTALSDADQDLTRLIDTLNKIDKKKH